MQCLAATNDYSNTWIEDPVYYGLVKIGRAEHQSSKIAILGRVEKRR
jgi:hypothetical protein